MKATVYDLMDAIGNVSDYVVMETSARSRQVRERAHIRWGVTAACVCYVAVMTLIGIYKSGLSAIEPPSGMFLPGKEVMGPSDTVDIVGTGTDTDAAEPRELRPCDSILKVLRGEGEFAQIMGSHGGRRFVDHITLQEWCDENSKGIVPSDVSLAFTVIDLDGNGSNEAVVSLTFDEGEYSVVNEYLILYLYDGEVYGISTVRRGFDGLTTDGTFLFDDGEYKEWRKITALTGIYDGRLLPGADYLYDVYMCVDPYAKDGPYFINGMPVSESEFDKALEEQRAKEGVVWYDLADIDDLDLEQYFDDVTADTDTTEPEAPRPCDSILKVLRGEGEFYNNIRHSDDTYSECLVHIVGDCFYSPYMGIALKIARFALVDMDGDGIEEAVLDCTLIDDDRYTYETVVLHLYKGEVHSYWFVPRAFYNLKADGTFEWLDGPNGGFSKITSFTDTDSIVDDFTYQDYHSDEGPYFVNNNTVSEAEFEKEYARLREKEDAVWYDFEGADLEQYFE